MNANKKSGSGNYAPSNDQNKKEKTTARMNSPSDQPSDIPPSQAPSHVSENLWTTREVAEFLHISAKSVFELRKKRGLPFVKLGGAVRFLPREVRDYLANSRRLTSHRLRQIARKGSPA